MSSLEQVKQFAKAVESSERGDRPRKGSPLKSPNYIKETHASFQKQVAKPDTSRGPSIE